jgi:3D (Asp-Asp-Asp) domain-containing protein
MKPTLLLPLAVVLSFTGCAVQQQSQKAAPSSAVSVGQPAKAGQHFIVRTTAYTHTEPGGRRNAVGGLLRYGDANSSAASDWSWLPIGTRFKMLCNGRTFLIEDYGSALVGRQTIDLYTPTRKVMRDWGCRQVEIEILEWGSPRRSLEVLGDRRSHAHVRTMVAKLMAQSKGMPDEMRRIQVN